MSFAVISCSLNPHSRSRILARAARDRLARMNAAVDFIDLQEHPLPLCDGAECYDRPEVREIARRIEQCEGALIAAPVYNFGPNAAAKNLIELTGAAWKNKVVGFLWTAGGQISYMSIMALANAMMLDFRTLIIPRFVYANPADFLEDEIVAAHIIERIDELTELLVRIAKAVRT